MTSGNSSVPIPQYQQVIEAVCSEVRNGTLQAGDILPSLNKMAEEFQVSRDTVLAAYKNLKEQGVVKAVQGKGYFIATTNIESSYNVFMLFDEFNSFKENLYNEFVKTLGEKARVDIYFHHFNKQTFSQHIEDSVGNYTHYLIMPAQIENSEEILTVLPPQSTYIIDQSNAHLDAMYSSVYQDFSEDTYQALYSAKNLLAKYQKMVMIHPGGKEPEGQKVGFLKFCKTNKIPCDILQQLNEYTLKKGEVYITPDDRCLVALVKRTKQQDLLLGKDIGIISYNDTPLKEVVAEGITTISTDFPLMGKNLAELIKKGTKENIKNPSSLIIRKSI